MKAEMRSYWNEKHSACEKKWLTGTTFEKYCTVFQLSPSQFQGKHVLEIGVGTCRATKKISTLTKSLDALDISTIALESLKPLLSASYTDGCELPSNTYDLIVCHLVVQHMSYGDWRALLGNAVRSLLEGGVFHFQFADVVGRNNGEGLDAQKGGGVLCSPATMKSWVHEAGAQLIKEHFREVKPDVWFHYFSITKKEAAA